MDILDKIGNMASETYKFTAEKTSKLAREAKIKMKINECKSKISEIYEEIGKIVYKQHVTEDIDVKEDLEKHCNDIDTYSNQIEEYKVELLNMKDKKQCQNCFKEMEIDDKFCPNCGKEQPIEEVKEAEIVENKETEDDEEIEEKDDNLYNEEE